MNLKFLNRMACFSSVHFFFCPFIIQLWEIHINTNINKIQNPLIYPWYLLYNIQHSMCSAVFFLIVKRKYVLLCHIHVFLYLILSHTKKNIKLSRFGVFVMYKVENEKCEQEILVGNCVFATQDIKEKKKHGATVSGMENNRFMLKVLYRVVLYNIHMMF